MAKKSLWSLEDRRPHSPKKYNNKRNSVYKLLKKLQKVDFDILNVRSTHWQSYSSFKSGVKDLEVMMQNVINSSFEQAPTFRTRKWNCLTIFSCKTSSIRRWVDKKLADICSQFNSFVNDIKHHFEHMKSKPIIGKAEPKFGVQQDGHTDYRWKFDENGIASITLKMYGQTTWDRKVR